MALKTKGKEKQKLIFYLQNENKSILAASTVALSFDPGQFSIPADSFDSLPSSSIILVLLALLLK